MWADFGTNRLDFFKKIIFVIIITILLLFCSYPLPTGNSMEADVEKGRECGFDDVLIKPVRPNDLLSIVTEWGDWESAKATKHRVFWQQRGEEREGGEEEGEEGGEEKEKEEGKGKEKDEEVQFKLEM